MDLRWPVQAVPGALGFELIDGLPKVTEYHYFVWKGVEADMHPYGACYHDFAGRMSAGVIDFLQARDVETVLVGGLATDTVESALAAMGEAGVRLVERAEELEQAA